jgi:hypothetical protein
MGTVALVREGAAAVSGWIKWEKDLEDDPRMLRMARELKRTCNAMTFNPVTVLCGALVRLWRYADSHIREDDTLDLGAREIDELVGVENFCSLMPPDWLREIDEHTVELPGFQAHNGVEAKKKALTQKRVSNHRQRKRNADPEVCNASALPDQTRPRPDQDLKRESSSNSVPQKRDAAPAERIFEHWRSEFGHQKAVLDPKRRRVIDAALKAYDETTLRASISGYRNSPHHMGDNERRTVYDDIELFLRDATHIENGLRFARGPPAPAMSVVEKARAKLREQLNGHGRVVSEQSGTGDSGVGQAVGVLR